MAERDFTAKINVDISDLKKSMQDAKQQAAMANAEFETVAATMDDWTKSSEGLAAKLNALEKKLKSQESVLSVYEASLADTREEYDKNSKKIEELKAKLQDLASKGISKTSDKYTQLEADLKSQTKTLESYERQLKNQQRSYDDNSKKVDQLKAKLQQLAKDGVSETSEEYQKYQTELTKAEKAQDRNKAKINDLNAKIVTQKDVVSKAQSAFDDYAAELNDTEKEYSELTAKQDAAKKSIDDLSLKVQKQKTELAQTQKAISDYSDEANNLGKSVEEAGDKADKSSGGFTVMKGALANLVSDGIELALQGLKKLGEAIIDAGKQSLGNYSEYEQLVGGVETLFKDSADIVQGYADNAFKSAGLSANKYMETVTSFSASLLQGLNGDTAKAAKIADMAIIDMSDNSNKMGTDMALIQNAYQGFTKKNYTMLDNLKLGYGGTQKEMARLINDSGVLGDTMKVTEKNVNEVSFDKIIEAIHVVQTEIGITGTTAVEAANTIEGSKNAMQAAWQNLLTGLADENADVGALFETFMESAETYLDNILPRIETLIGNAVDFVKGKLEEKFPTAFKVVETVLSKVVDLFGWVKDNSAEITAALAGIGTALVAWNLATVVTNIVKMVKALKAMGAAAAFSAAKQWLLNTALLANPIGLIIAAIAGLVTAFIVLWKRSEKFRNFWIGLWEKIKATVSPVIEWVVAKFKELWEFLQPYIEKAKELIGTTMKEIGEMFSAAWGVIKAVWDLVKPYFESIWNSIKTIFSAVVTILGGYFEAAWAAIKLVWDVVVKYFTLIWDNIKTVFSAVAHTLGAFFKAAWNNIKIVWDLVVGYFKTIWENIKLIFSVVKKVLSGDFSGAWESIKEIWNNVKDYFSDVWDGIKGIFGNVTGFFKTAFSEAWKAIKGVFSNVGDFFSGVWDTIKSKFKEIGTKIGDAIGGAFKTAINAVLATAENILNAPINAINGLLDKISGVVDIPRLNTLSLPRLKKGGVLERGQVGLLEGDGAEAVVPLDQNKKWIRATASDLKKSLASEGVIGGKSGSSAPVTNNYNFTQNNSSPKALSRLEIYRQSKNLLKLKGAT